MLLLLVVGMGAGTGTVGRLPQELASVDRPVVVEVVIPAPLGGLLALGQLFLDEAQGLLVVDGAKEHPLHAPRVVKGRVPAANANANAAVAGTPAEWRPVPFQVLPLLNHAAHPLLEPVQQVRAHPECRRAPPGRALLYHKPWEDLLENRKKRATSRSLTKGETFFVWPDQLFFTIET